MKSPYHQMLAALATGAIVCALPSSALAAAYTWDGGGTDNLFGTATNWNPDGAPATGSGNDLHFAGGTRLTPNNNYGDWSSFRNIMFDSGASSFTVSGNPMDLHGKIENNSTVLQTVSLSQFSFNNGNAELDPTVGDLTINAQNIWTNGNTIKVWGNHTLTINNTGGNGISQGGGLAIQNGATVILTGSNNYTGATTFDGTNATLRLGNGGTTGSISASSTINFANASDNNTLAVNRSDSPTFSNAIQTGSNRANIAVASGATATLSGAITGSGEFWATGAGTLVITANAGSATRTSSNVIDGGGTLSVPDFSTSTLGSGNYYIKSGTLQYTGASTTTARLASFALQSPTSTIEVTQSGTTLTLSQDLGGYTGGGLVKAGAGTLTLSAANAFNGVTKVNAGTLVLANASALQNSPIDVTGAGAITFAATNTIGGLNNAGGTSKTLAVGSNTLTLNSTAISSIAIPNGAAFASSPAIDVTSSGFTLGGSLNLGIGSALANSTYTFNIFDGNTAGAFTSVNVSGSVYSATLNAGNSYSYIDGLGNSYQFNNMTGVLTLTAVPEPHEYAIAIAGLLGVLICIRRRRMAV